MPNYTVYCVDSRFYKGRFVESKSPVVRVNSDLNNVRAICMDMFKERTRKDLPIAFEIWRGTQMVGILADSDDYRKRFVWISVPSGEHYWIYPRDGGRLGEKVTGFVNESEY